MRRILAALFFSVPVRKKKKNGRFLERMFAFSGRL
ncbi:hypothetical protein BACCAP_01307 [Pseudoflavonifractor capillosus ATCC 29799]|uniref:Uncharacterized protein n=1 Tax=Pseudoflavonifractor capillosus ATCC 29799 TaxID=411467 RepID=A6NSX8_9FIRM|nr:hypothetical protein BACCAP_01307 [Pseudoflavonifractor capillosus ATCC 29799]